MWYTSRKQYKCQYPKRRGDNRMEMCGAGSHSKKANRYNNNDHAEIQYISFLAFAHFRACFTSEIRTMIEQSEHHFTLTSLTICVSVRSMLHFCTFFVPFTWSFPLLCARELELELERVRVRERARVYILLFSFFVCLCLVYICFIIGHSKWKQCTYLSFALWFSLFYPFLFWFRKSRRIMTYALLSNYVRCSACAPCLRVSLCVRESIYLYVYIHLFIFF